MGTRSSIRGGDRNIDEGKHADAYDDHRENMERPGEQQLAAAAAAAAAPCDIAAARRSLGHGQPGDADSGHPAVEGAATRVTRKRQRNEQSADFIKTVGSNAPPGQHGFRLIVASDIIIEDEVIPAVWSSVKHFLSEERGSIFVMTCIERPTLMFRKGVVVEEAVDTTLKAFVDAGEDHGFEAGEAARTTALGDGGATEVRTLVFSRANCAK